MRLRFRYVPFLILVSASLVAGGAASAQSDIFRPVRRLISSPVDEKNLVTLPGNTRPETLSANDRGRADDSLLIPHMQLQLKLPPEKLQELDQRIQDLQNPASPDYHSWLTPEQFKREFSLAPEDVGAVSTWLESQGFAVHVIYPQSIDFSGTAGQVRRAFHSEIHNFDVGGSRHFANASDPMIPAALAPAVAGVAALNDFMPRPLNHPRANYTVGSVSDLVAPADLATIYDFNPLFARGVSGQGQTIVVIEDTDVFSAADWSTFRATLGLSPYSSGSFQQIHPAPPSGTNNCSDPGVNGDDAEAILDAEWATAGAPNATVLLASCADTTNFGGFIALQNLLNESSTPPSIVSLSYGESEPQLGAAANAYINALYMQAAAEGVSIFVSAGDEGAASTDSNLSYATHGVAVSGFASTPYNVAVGGTDFGDSFTGSNNIYWNASNSSAFGSAKSYVPEIPWNDSCASSLIASYHGFGTSYGSSGFCNSSTGTASFLTTVAASGGPSGCATGNPATSGVVGGSCAGYAKPAWQSVAGNPSDGVRDIPDLALFAANGVWGHYYVVCYSDTSRGGSSCGGSPNTWSGFGGTSVASPIMAAMQSLVNQVNGTSAGNPNPIYYALASAEYGSSGNPLCNSSLGAGIAGTCVFNDVTQGDIDINCRGSRNCYLPSGTYGVLSTSNSQFQAAYAAGTGWDFATGIGTVNANNLVNNWPKPPSITSAATASFTVGTPGTFAVTTTGTPAPTLTELGNLPSGITFNSTTGVLGGTAGTGTGGSYTINFTASNGVGANATQSFTLTIKGSTGSSGTTAAFLFPDSTTQGSWTKAYGADGYFLANANQSPASYDPSFAVQGQQNWTWAASSSDARALQIPGSSSGIAATWYSNPSFTFDVNIGTGTHQLAVYAVDWDKQGRSETIQILDATSGSVLDSRSISSFTGGIYLVWNIAGHVTVKVSCTGGVNAVVSGVFFGGAGTSPASSILSIAKSHAGNFAAGQQNAIYSVVVSNAAAATATSGVVTVSESVPSGMALVSMAGNGWTCAANNCSRSDVLSGGLSYPPLMVTVNVAATASSPQVNQVTVSGGGSASATASDSTTITGIGGSGTNSATFVAQDATTEGNWQLLYGSDGYSLANANQLLPPYDSSFSMQGQQNWTWNSSTSDPRALRIPGGSAGIAATWYNNPSSTFDVNIGSGTHQIAIYAVDWDQQGRSEMIQVLDATSGTVLDSRSISNFTSGVYLVWSISGHVTFKVSCTGGVNAVASGVFFGGAGSNLISPILSITKSHTGNFAAGQQNAAYSVTVSNAAGVSATTGTVTVSETVPSGMTLVSMAGSGWTCAANDCSRSDALSGGTSYPPITVTVNVAGNASSPQINQVTVSGGGSANGSASDSTIISGTGGGGGNSASFVAQDASTQGNWQGVYGGGGYSLANANQALPPYDPTLAEQGQQSWTWNSGTSDPRALRIPGGSGGIAATWYNNSSFSMDVNITSGTHQVAVYALDWDNQGRSETIQILDATTGAVLDSRSVSSFNSGLYLVWNISGHVTIKVSANNPPNAVISGIFFN